MRILILLLFLISVSPSFSNDTLYCVKKNGKVKAVPTMKIEHLKIGHVYFAGRVVSLTDSTIYFNVYCQDYTLAGEKTLFARKKSKNKNYCRDTTVQIPYEQIHAIYINRGEKNIVTELRYVGMYVAHFTAFIGTSLLMRQVNSGPLNIIVPFGLTLASFTYTGKLIGPSKFMNTTNKTLTNNRPK